MSEVLPNIDELTVAGFGHEWAAFDQQELAGIEFQRWFDAYFGVFPWHLLPPNAEGFDLGCGSGRWATAAAPRVGRLHCIDASAQALAVARRRLSDVPNVEFHLAGSHEIPLADNSQDFGYSLGVLHHIPDTERALSDCVRKVKPGGWFLVYLYYAFDNRPGWFRSLWRLSDVGRQIVARLPFRAKKALTSAIAATVYWPLSRTAKTLERRGVSVRALPLSAYRDSSFYTMRTDALDRFGTRLEHRFTRSEIEDMMRRAGLVDVAFSEREPFWVAVGRRASS